MRVDIKGLEFWSAQCETLAGKLAATTATASSLASGQATATAVSTGQALIHSTASSMAARVGTMGTHASAAASAYAADDEQSAQRLATVAPGPAVA
jgi:hypothetical protein